MQHLKVSILLSKEDWPSSMQLYHAISLDSWLETPESMCLGYEVPPNGLLNRLCNESLVFSKARLKCLTICDLAVH